MRVSLDEFRSAARAMIGLGLSHCWVGFGSAVFFEFGDLSDEISTHGRVSKKGEATVMIEWSWRIERSRSIAFGSFSTDRVIRSRIPKLSGHRVVDIVAEGRLPEL